MASVDARRQAGDKELARFTLEKAQKSCHFFMVQLDEQQTSEKQMKVISSNLTVLRGRKNS